LDREICETLSHLSRFPFVSFVIQTPHPNSVSDRCTSTHPLWCLTTPLPPRPPGPQ